MPRWDERMDRLEASVQAGQFPFWMNERERAHLTAWVAIQRSSRSTGTVVVYRPSQGMVRGYDWSGPIGRHPGYRRGIR